MRSTTPAQDSEGDQSPLLTSPVLSVRSFKSSDSGHAPPPSEALHLSDSVTETMGAKGQPMPAPVTPPAPSVPPGLTSPPITAPPPLIGPLVSLDALFFLQFLAIHFDSYGMRQALIWLLSPFGRTTIRCGTIIVHRLRRGLECYGKITNLVIRSGSEAMFQLLILGWQTPAGWRAPAGNVYSFLIAPLARCPPEFSNRAWMYFSYPGSLQQHALDVVHSVRGFLTGDPLETLKPNDWITGWLLCTHLITPATQTFGGRIGAGLTIATEDLNVPLGEGMIPPPPTFYPYGIVSITFTVQHATA